MKQTILIRNVQVVQGDVMPRCDMLIQDGVIAKFGRDLPDAAGLTIDGSRLTALPGFRVRPIKRTSSPAQLRHLPAALPA